VASASSKYSDMLMSINSEDRWCGDSSGSPPSSFGSLSPEPSPQVYDGTIPFSSEVLHGSIGYNSHMPDAPFGSWYSDASDIPWGSSLYVFYLV
jgi:hypothetical protein